MLGSLDSIDNATAALVKLAAVLAGGSEHDVRASLSDAATDVPHDWVEELILQTYLFAGFPRALNAAREWRRISGTEPDLASQPAPPDGFYNIAAFTQLGEATCATVYGNSYSKLRHNIRMLHPELDAWMIVEGYGKVLSRPALDLARRELCIIAACAIAKQDRQLHAHLLGALNSGASVPVVEQTLHLLKPLLLNDDFSRYTALWERVKGK